MDQVVNGIVGVLAVVGVASIVIFYYVFKANKEEEEANPLPLAKFQIEWRSGVKTIIYIEYKTDLDLTKCAYVLLTLKERAREIDSVKQVVLMHRNWPRQEDLDIVTIV